MGKNDFLAKQRQMQQAYFDAALAEAYGEGLHDTFFKRYEFAREYDYTKGRWK